jgi:hypothetical protein
MFPFWNDVVAPVIKAVRARRIVEVGALRGENSELMLERLGDDVELHVIDPVPEFDPGTTRRGSFTATSCPTRRASATLSPSTRVGS